MSIRTLLMAVGRAVALPITMAWRAFTTRPTCQIFGAVKSGSNYVILGFSSSAFTSPDAITWTARATPLTTQNFLLMKVGSRLWAGGLNRATAYSDDDGLTWTLNNLVPAGNGAVLGGFPGAPGAPRYILCGSSFIASSTDFVTWTTFTIGIEFRGVAYGAGLYVVVGQSANCFTSPDGVTWTSRTASMAAAITSTTTLRAVIYANGIFVAIGTSGKCATSSDGINWTNNASFTTAMIVQCRGLIWDGAQFVATGSSGRCATSPTGVTWTDQPSLRALATTERAQLLLDGSRILAFDSGVRVDVTP